MATETRTAARREAAERLLGPRVLEELRRESPGIDRGALLHAILDSWGGYGRFAEDVAREFEHAARGSMVRQRILDLVCRMIHQETAAVGEAGAPEKLSDEELRLALRSAAAGLLEGTAADAAPPPAETGPAADSGGGPAGPQ